MHIKDEHVELLKKLVAVQIRQILYQFFRPYLDALKETIDEVLEKKVMPKKNLDTLVNGVDKLKNTPDLTEILVKATVETAAKCAGLPTVVVKTLVIAGGFAYDTYKDLRNPALSMEEFLRRLARNAETAVLTTAATLVGAGTGAAVGTLLFPVIGTTAGSIVGSLAGAAVGGVLGFFTSRRH